MVAVLLVETLQSDDQAQVARGWTGFIESSEIESTTSATVTTARRSLGY